ncbi:hypothetical protein SKAU_G00214700 [Synaphobranchus kaupii]|uniref:Uncharacterized protein n=1 Tax=Synaphobranchus kaupii TaxID=118154 RepID=A0A9Q1F9L4_SYNKA|nr:hypothetical protein SKAU_G00214700 [Synaphobranchus kaupii]
MKSCPWPAATRPPRKSNYWKQEDGCSPSSLQRGGILRHFPPSILPADNKATLRGVAGKKGHPPRRTTKQGGAVGRPGAGPWHVCPAAGSQQPCLPKVFVSVTPGPRSRATVTAAGRRCLCCSPSATRRKRSSASALCILTERYFPSSCYWSPRYSLPLKLFWS